MTDTVTGLVLARLTDYAQPLFTFYDEGTGERTELSGATLGNWAAKIANYLRDEIGVAPGDAVRVDLPEHWQTAAVVLGAWWAGARVLVGDAGQDPLVAFVTRDGIDAHDVDEVVVVPLDPFAMGSRDLPLGVSDFGDAVRTHGDQYRPGGAGPLAVNDLPTSAVSSAASDVSAGQRVLSTREWASADGLVANFAAPLLAGASLVWVRGADDARIDALAATEKVDVVLR
ncbi:hypothetical protein nbrc107696_25080 [Gordonia spumicola]|uniref:TIGR03089 family protein n=1 Tax=Gordonia spumicola TaxID=589161 RepID=A0A7I9V9Z5_9ACTN|nr:TIGR03089 family protein [Gordonia spumicola]GEE02062.1 hypothetical protein nbrc107696_25080 [Gordonia spumicola]